MTSLNQSTHVEGKNNIIVQAVGDGININVGLPYLTLIPPRNRRPALNREIDLLNPYRCAFAIVGREADMERLWDWLHSPSRISVRTIIGRAGAGKT